jgi:undecaprenyl-diphosphatase
MLPLLVTAVIAITAGLLAFATLASFDRGRARKKDVVDAPPPPSRFGLAIGALLGLIALTLVLGGLAEAIQQQSFVVRWDDRVEQWAATHAGPVATTALRVVTHAGDTITVVVIALLVVGALLWAGHRRLALFVVTVVLGQWAIANLAKELVKRARPQLDPLSAFSGFSFPSGHATAAAATYLALAIVVIALKPTWRRPVLVAIAVTIAVAVAASRALLGVHWFSDVIGGLILGWAWCVICAVLYDVLRRKPSPSSARSATTSSPSVT